MISGKSLPISGPQFPYLYNAVISLDERLQTSDPWLDLGHTWVFFGLRVSFFNREPPFKSSRQNPGLWLLLKIKPQQMAPTFPRSQKWLEWRSRCVAQVNRVLSSSPQSPPLPNICPTPRPTEHGHVSSRWYCWLVFFLRGDIPL